MESDEVKSLKNALFDTSKDFLQLKQCFEEELISKSNELSIFITKLEKELKAKDQEILLLLEKISDLNNKNKIFDKEKYYTNRL